MRTPILDIQNLDRLGAVVLERSAEHGPLLRGEDGVLDAQHKLNRRGRGEDCGEKSADHNGFDANLTRTLLVAGDNYIGTDEYLALNSSFELSVGDTGCNDYADLTDVAHVGTDDYLVMNISFDVEGDS